MSISAMSSENAFDRSSRKSRNVCRSLFLAKKFADQGVTFTDCLSFVLMKREKLRQVFGFDHHFEAAGFRLLPGH